MSKYTLILDSSQISTFCECPELWNNQYHKLLVPVQRRDSTAMNAGTYGHKLLDIYYKLRCAGSTLNEAAATALSYNPDTDTCECGCSLYNHKTIPMLNIKECTRCKKCANFRAKPFELNIETRIAVQNRLRDYFFKYQHNDFQPLSADHVEVGFSEIIYEDYSNLFILEGRMDMFGTYQGIGCVVDHKFQMRMHDLYQKSIQFKNYALIAKKLMLVINYIRLAKTVNDQTLARVPVCFTVPELLEWKQKLIKIYFRIKQQVETFGELGQPLEQNWSACPGRFNYSCPYTPLCEEYNKDMVAIKEKQLYTVNAEPWRPW